MRGGGFENVEKLKNFECGKMGKWSNRLAAIAQLVERLTSTENERRRHQEVSSSNLDNPTNKCNRRVGKYWFVAITC